MNTRERVARWLVRRNGDTWDKLQPFEVELFLLSADDLIAVVFADGGE